MTTSSSDRSDRFGRIERLAPWVAGLLLAAPVLAAFYPPMTDLPFHEGAVGLLRHRNDPAYVPSGLYLLNLGEPNQLFYLLGWALSYVTSTRWAVKIVVAAAVLAVPVTAGRFARHAGSSRLAALLVAPMALGWLFSWGLIANLLGLSVLLVTLPWLDRFEERPSARTAAWALAAVPLLYLAHEAMMFVYGGAAILLAFCHPLERVRTAVRLTPALLVALVHEVFIHWVQQFVGPVVRGVPVTWHSPLHKIERIPYIIIPATDPVVQVFIAALCLLTLAMMLGLRRSERRARDTTAVDDAPVRATEGQARASRLARVQAFALAHRWEVFAGACFALYMAFPLTLSGSTLVYQRFFPPAYAVFVAIAAPRDLGTRAARVARIAVLALPAATLLVGWPAFVDSSRQYEALETVIASIPPGNAVAEVDLGPGDPARAFSLGTASGRILATRGGRLSYAFTDSPISPMVLDPRYQWNESLGRMAFDTGSLRPQHDLELYRYVLLRSTDPRLEVIATLVLQREAEYVTENGDWVLLRSRADVIPLASPEPPVLGPQETVRARVNAAIAVVRGESPAPMRSPDASTSRERTF